MDTIGWAMVGAFVVLVIGAFTYAFVRLRHESHGDVNPKAKRLARIFLLPPIFDPLFAKALQKREIVGLVILALVLVLAVALF